MLRVENGHVPPDMRLIRVKQNDTVKLQWSTDKPMTIHLHGYDIERRVMPATIASMSFAAKTTGRFAIVTHDGPAGRESGHRERVLLYLEVYPR